jgi:hypothetical protein
MGSELVVRIPSTFKRLVIVGALLWLGIVTGAWVHVVMTSQGRAGVGFDTLIAIGLTMTLTVSATACFGIPIVALAITRGRKPDVLRNIIAVDLPFAFSLPVLVWSLTDGNVRWIAAVVIMGATFGWLLRLEVATNAMEVPP